MSKALGLVLAVGLAAGSATHAYADDASQPPPAAAAPVPGEAPPPDTSAGAPTVDPAYGERGAAPVHAGRDITVRYRPDRSSNVRLMIGVLGGAALAFGGVGLYYHLDSRDASDELSTHKFTAQTWTAERQDRYDSAHDAKTIATISYSIGGAFLIATVIAFIVTEPAQEVMTIHPHVNEPSATIVTPIPGGAFVAKGWRF